jgi:predicted P-loop ATPase
LVARAEDFPVLVDYVRVPGKGRWGGKIAAVLENLIVLLEQDPEFPWRMAWDDFSQEIVVEDKRSGEVGRALDHHLVEMRVWCGERNWQEVPKGLMRDAVEAVVRRRTVDLGRQWITGLEWDGVDRIGELVHRMRLTPGEYTTSVLRYLLTSHAGRLLQPGLQADAIVVLRGPQGAGKSRAIEALAPVIAGVGGTYRVITIEDLLSPERAARALKGCVVANLDELRGLSRREASEVKTALSRSTEGWTPKYKESWSEYQRRCMIYATTK